MDSGKTLPVAEYFSSVQVLYTDMDQTDKKMDMYLN